MVKPGNIDLSKRPLVHHPNGSVSSLYSATFGAGNNQTVVLPLVSPDGRMLTADQAFADYKKTGKSLGVFRTQAQADAYSEYLHNKQGAFQTWKNGGQYSPTAETWSKQNP